MTRTAADAAQPTRTGWLRDTISQIRLSQRVFWQDIAFAIIGALMPIAMGLAPAFQYRDSHASIGGAALTSYLLAGGASATLLWIFYTTINSAARRRETRVYKRLRATPLRDSSILFGETGSAALPALAQAAVVLVVGMAYLHAGTPAHPLLLILILVIGAAAYGLLAIGVSGLLPSGEVATWLVTPFIFGLWYLSGAITPLSSFPDWLATISHYLPTTAAADALRVCYIGFSHPDLDGTAHVSGMWSLVRPAVVLIAWGAVGALCWKRYFRWDPRKST